MITNDEKFYSLLKNLRKVIHTVSDGVSVSTELTHCSDFIDNHYDDKDKFEKYNELFDLIICDNVLQNKLIDNKTFEKMLLQFCNVCSGMSVYEIWSIIFSKRILQLISFNHPIVITDILQIVKSDIANNQNKNWIKFDFDNIDIFNLFDIVTNNLSKYIVESTNYSLYYDAKVRIDVCKYIYEKYLMCADHTFRVFFPQCGTGIESLLIAYTICLFDECKKNQTLDNCIFILNNQSTELLNCFDNKFDGFNQTFVKLRQSFCEQNNIKLKDVKTNLKLVKKKIIVRTDEDLKDKKIKADLVFFNPFYRTSLLNQLNNYSGNTILTIVTNEELNQFEENNVKYEKISSFFDKDKEQNVDLISLCVETKAEFVEQKKEPFEDIYINRYKYKPKELKRLLAISNFIVNERQMLRYAELLTLAGQFSKSYDIIKQNYEQDCDYSFHILTAITENCKNLKLNQAIKKFVVDTALDKKGFGEALLGSIVDGVDDYFEKNPTSSLKDKYWL